jgi:hypothetical protein
VTVSSVPFALLCRPLGSTPRLRMCRFSHKSLDLRLQPGPFPSRGSGSLGSRIALQRLLTSRDKRHRKCVKLLRSEPKSRMRPVRHMLSAVDRAAGMEEDTTAAVTTGARREIDARSAEEDETKQSENPHVLRLN